MTSKEIDANVLVAARDEYTNQLCYYLCPLIDEGFISIYKDAQEQTRSKDPKKASVLRNFQIFCKAIPTWNDTLLNNESERIKKTCPFLMDLLTAVFVSNVKILAAIKLKGNSKNIKIKIPTTNIFIHKIYTSCAKFFYYEPQYYHIHRSFHKNETNRKTRVDKIKEKITTTISDMLPVQDVLDEYLTGGFDSNSEEEEELDEAHYVNPKASDVQSVDYGTDVMENTEFDLDTLLKEINACGDIYAFELRRNRLLSLCIPPGGRNQVVLIGGHVHKGIIDRNQLIRFENNGEDLNLDLNQFFLDTRLMSLNMGRVAIILRFNLMPQIIFISKKCE